MGILLRAKNKRSKSQQHSPICYKMKQNEAPREKERKFADRNFLGSCTESTSKGNKCTWCTSQFFAVDTFFKLNAKGAKGASRALICHILDVICKLDTRRLEDIWIGQSIPKIGISIAFSARLRESQSSISRHGVAPTHTVALNRRFECNRSRIACCALLF